MRPRNDNVRAFSEREKDMKRWTKKIEDIMAAATFAEAGEFKTAQEILKKGKRLLLALQAGHLDKKTLKYALNACKRVVAKLDILYTSSMSVTEGVDPVLKEFLSELEREGINYRLIRKKGCLEKEVKEYTNSNEEIAFVVINSSDALDADRSKSKGLSEAWHNLQCPLVVVMDSTIAEA
ncbi:MAG: hypothetical protein HXY47_02425 [Nitrospirae bacterium]|nr:hypothetical protein [Nitrospirota bacterium]